MLSMNQINNYLLFVRSYSPSYSCRLKIKTILNDLRHYEYLVSPRIVYPLFLHKFHNWYHTIFFKYAPSVIRGFPFLKPSWIVLLLRVDFNLCSLKYNLLKFQFNWRSDFLSDLWGLKMAAYIQCLENQTSYISLLNWPRTTSSDEELIYHQRGSASVGDSLVRNSLLTSNEILTYDRSQKMLGKWSAHCTTRIHLTRTRASSDLKFSNVVISGRDLSILFFPVPIESKSVSESLCVTNHFPYSYIPHRLNVARLSLFCRYFDGKYSD